jgi:hypothetical protein
MDTPQPDQPAIKSNYLTHRSWLVLILTLLIAAFIRFSQPGFFLGSHPAAAIIDLFIITLLWLDTYRYLNFTAALIAGMMYTFAPWSLLYSSTVILNTPQLLLLLAFACTIYARIEGKKWAWFISVPAVLATILVFHIIISSAYYTDSPNITLSSEALISTAQVVSGLEVENAVLFGQDAANLLANVPRPQEIWLLLLGGAAIVGFPALWFRSRLIFFLIALWVTVPILVFTPTWLRTIYPSYLMVSLPALCLLAGAGVAWLIKLMPGKPYSRMIILAAYGVVFLSQALWWRGVLRYLEMTAR